MADKSAVETIEGASPAKTKAQVLTDVFSLATQFSTCVEAFNLIHPSKDNDHAQKVALAKLGLQQGRLLIFGDAVGIAAPPATIARHMIPSRPGITNPDPYLPVNFGVRDVKLDGEVINAKIRRSLHEIAGRPSHMTRDELMTTYGMKSPKSFSRLEYPALDTNRLEGFREKYVLLQDLLRQTGTRASIKRNASMATNHWVVKDGARFSRFVATVRTEVDALIELMDVKEQIDRGIRSDIRCMAWHPDPTGPAVQQDWEKLRLIREACVVDYPEYIEVVDSALQYIHEELKEASLANRRASLGLVPTDGPAGGRRKSDYDIRSAPLHAPAAEKTHLQLSAERACDGPAGKEKRPGWLSAFKIKSWSKSSKNVEKQRSKSTPGPDGAADPTRSLSEGEAVPPEVPAPDDSNALEPVRSKSLSAIPDAHGPLDLESRIRRPSVDKDTSDMQVIDEHGGEVTSFPERDVLDKYALSQVKTVSSEESSSHLYGVTTVNSLIDRHDKYPGMGRIETKDIREVSHAHGLGRPEDG